MMHHVATSLLILYLIATAVGSTRGRGGNARAEFGEINNRTYYFGGCDYEPAETVGGAEAACTALNMRLVRFDTEEEYFALYSYIIANCVHSWVNFWTNGVKVNDTWVWRDDGSEFEFTKWAWNEPKNLPVPLCMQFDNPMGWVAEDCTKPFNYICEET